MGVVGVQLMMVDKKPKMTVCDVGQGLGVVFSEGRSQVVYDFGRAEAGMVECLEKVMGLDRIIELAIVSHEDSDHVGGLLEVQKYFDIEQIKYAKDLAINDIYSVGEMRFDIRWPSNLVGDSNKDSVVVEATVNNKKILLMGDVTSEEEQALVWRNMISDIDVLVVSHHGSNTATSEELLDKVRPETAIISVGKNSFGHPTEEVLNRLEERDIEILRTDFVGDIAID